MTPIAILLATLFALSMTWRGYRRGALATLASWIPAILAIGVLTLAVWRDPHRPSVAIMTGLAAAVAVLIASMLVLRIWRQRSNRRDPNDCPDSTSSDGTSRRWLWQCNRIAGAGLGLLCSAVACLGFTCLVSTLAFAYSVRAQTRVAREEGNEPPLWVTKLSETCRTLADLTDDVIISHVPRLSRYGEEARALVIILNARPDEIKHLAELHDLRQLQELPEVKAALHDDHYIGLFMSLREGDVTVLSELVDSDVTHRLIACPEIRDLTQTLTPLSLADDLTRQAPDLNAESK